nr:MAG TPA: hypothetical protein [Caudoviricetes sp.]
MWYVPLHLEMIPFRNLSLCKYLLQATRLHSCYL